MSNLSSFLEDNTGGFSSTRLAFLLWTIGVLATWIYASLSSTNCGLQKIDPSVVTILGILMGGKVSQRFFENKQLSNSDESTANQGNKPAG